LPLFADGVTLASAGLELLSHAVKGIARSIEDKNTVGHFLFILIIS
jgi:hypothetical protein